MRGNETADLVGHLNRLVITDLMSKALFRERTAIL